MRSWPAELDDWWCTSWEGWGSQVWRGWRIQERGRVIVIWRICGTQPHWPLCMSWQTIIDKLWDVGNTVCLSVNLNNRENIVHLLLYSQWRSQYLHGSASHQAMNKVLSVDGVNIQQRWSRVARWRVPWSSRTYDSRGRQWAWTSHTHSSLERLYYRDLYVEIENFESSFDCYQRDPMILTCVCSVATARNKGEQMSVLNSSVMRFISVSWIAIRNPSGAERPVLWRKLIRAQGKEKIGENPRENYIK